MIPKATFLGIPIKPQDPYGKVGSGFLTVARRIRDRQVRNGHIKRLTDSDIQSSVLESRRLDFFSGHITTQFPPVGHHGHPKRLL